MTDTPTLGCRLFVKAHIHGVEVWVQRPTLEPGSDGPLAPKEHIIDGNLNPQYYLADSYAHAYSDGRVLRYYKQIGTKADITVEETTP